MNYTLVNFDDWQALYNERGEKVLESDRLEAAEIVNVIGGRIKFASEIFDIEAAQEGAPEHLADFPIYAFTQ